MDRRRFLALAGIGLAGTAGCAGDAEEGGDGGSGDGGSGDGDSGETPADGDGGASTDAEQTETTPQTASVAVGEVVEGDRMSMIVRGVERTESIGEFQQADSGNTFVVVTLAVKNRTQGEFVGFSSLLQTQLKDSDDYTYEQTVATTGQTFQGGQLAPGEVSRGDLVYEVPKDAGGLVLQFDFQSFSFFEFDRVTVDLEAEASSMGDLSQDLQVDVHDVGESVSRGDVTVAVNDVGFETSLDQFSEAASGNEFAIVDVTTENGTDEPLSLSTLLQMKMKDGEGNSYQPSISALTALDRAYDESQPLAPGESRRGQMAYEVPEGASPLYWIFEFTIWVDGDKTFWQVR